MKSLLIGLVLLAVPSVVLAGGHCNQNLRQNVVRREFVVEDVYVVPQQVRVEKVIVEKQVRHHNQQNQRERGRLFGRQRSFRLNLERNVN